MSVAQNLHVDDSRHAALSIATMPPPVGGLSREDYRNAMARLGAAVNIITTDGPGGRAGFTASAVSSVTDTPPTLLVCLNRSASVYPAFRDNQALCVNTLGPGHQHLSNLFGGKTPMAQRFAACDWKTAASGAPILAQAAVSFDCRVTSRTCIGTHEVLFCQVLAVELGAGTGSLVYFDRRYHEIGVSG
ncbi:pyrimidine utilization flavin reductase protein F [Corticibacter populi]|uniref:FMN reductase (NADH) RutF n=1 Tax=Corticibacter populi TaxID=1550736 RepID=A0A3M6QPG4_9BURK|nr:pyrimidine utilization flavin reductase protein F [Corticibacter populi]RMX04937.1 pyrimidine utilization flavin reductase protein F [Corticibacter populi]RZS33638.1 flavin reductase [Corticibacter populi]